MVLIINNKTYNTFKVTFFIIYFPLSLFGFKLRHICTCEYQEHKCFYLICVPNLEMYYFVIIVTQNINALKLFYILMHKKYKIFVKLSTFTRIIIFDKFSTKYTSLNK